MLQRYEISPHIGGKSQILKNPPFM